MIVLDTDHLSCLEWGSDESAALRERLAATVDPTIVVSIVSYEEQMRGWMAYLAKVPQVTKQVEKSAFHSFESRRSSRFDKQFRSMHHLLLR